MSSLPKKLNREPLIDVAFELRFNCDIPASNSLPGVLATELKSVVFEQLPAMGIPKNIRDADPSLLYAPVIKLTWDRFVIQIGDRSLGIGCLMPYPGWSEFKAAIIQVLEILKRLPFNFAVERFSLKYVDLLDEDLFPSRSDVLNAKLEIAGKQVGEETFQFRVEIPDGPYIKAIGIVSPAQVQHENNTVRQGIVVDIDIIRLRSDRSKWFDNLDEMLEDIHSVNKTTFFNCVTDSTLKQLEPKYE